MTSSDFLFCQTNSPKPKNIYERKAANPQISEAGTANIWPVCLISDTKCLYIFCQLKTILFCIFILLSVYLCVSLGAFNYLKENFSNAPSLDMSSPSLCMLVRLMVAQVQECVFERVTLTMQDTHFTSQLRVAQEAARVS